MNFPKNFINFVVTMLVLRLYLSVMFPRKPCRNHFLPSVTPHSRQQLSHTSTVVGCVLLNVDLSGKLAERVCVHGDATKRVRERCCGECGVTDSKSGCDKGSRETYRSPMTSNVVVEQLMGLAAGAMGTYLSDKLVERVSHTTSSQPHQLLDNDVRGPWVSVCFPGNLVATAFAVCDVTLPTATFTYAFLLRRHVRRPLWQARRESFPKHQY